MKSALSVALLALLALALPSLGAQEEVERVKIELKSGEAVEGVLKDVSDSGVTLVGNDGVPLFLKWAYTRGDKHFELRKRATNYKSLSSIVKLADFCHDFALDRKEAEALTAALQLAPGDEDLRKRLDALPKFSDLKTPDRPGPDIVKPEPKPEPQPEPEPEPKPEPASGRKPVLKIECTDPDAVASLAKEMENLGYKISSGKDYDVQVRLELNLTLVKNPKWMGAELYAIYDGTCEFQALEKAAKTPFESKSVEVKNVRSNKDKAEAKRMTIDELMVKIRGELDKALKKRG